jgi:hypothetical protein
LTTTCLALSCLTPAALAQQTPTPTKTTTTTTTTTVKTPPPQSPAPSSSSSATAEPSTAPQESAHPGHPSQTSAGGTERKLPDHAGIFKRGPISIIEGPIKKGQEWTKENLRLDWGLRAAFGFQQASGGPGERTAASQDYRTFGTLHLWNWKEEDKGWAGNVYTRVEWRSEMFTKIPPYQLNTQIGTLFTTTYGQDEHDLAVVQLYYEQFLFDGGLRFRIGKIDPDDYFNLGRFADDYRYFDNTLFSAFPASNHPSGGLGFNLQWYINPEWTLTGGMSDVQGRKTLSGFDTIDDGKFFYGLDVTYSPKIEGWGQGNYRLGIEYRDAVEDRDRPEDTSFYFNVDQEVVKDVAPFLRYGYGTGRSTGIEHVFSVGVGVDNPFSRPGDAWGFGIGFDIADDDVQSDRDIEYASELFYRFQLTRAIQWTVGGQLIFEPILAEDDDFVGIFQMRLVIDF